MSPVNVPGTTLSRSGRVDATVRNVSTRATCCSSRPTPRDAVALTDEIAASETATTAIATSTSMSVNPAVPAGRRHASQNLARDNFDASGQPIHADFITDTGPRQGDGAAAGHAGRKKADGAERRRLVAALRQQRVDGDVVRELHHPSARAGAD